MLGSCPSGKRRHTSVRAARLAHRDASWRLRVYPCGACGGFHVTASEKHKDRIKPKNRSKSR